MDPCWRRQLPFLTEAHAEIYATVDVGPRGLSARGFPIQDLDVDGTVLPVA